MWLPFAFARRSAKVSRAATGRKACFVRPAVEALESRWRPSCVVFQRDDTLFIRGDNRDNDIVLADHRDNIQVTCDGRSAGFSSVRRFDVSTGGGGDSITAILRQEQPATWDIATGAGDDRVAGEFSWGETPNVDFRADLGDGLDSLMTTFIPVEQFRPEAPLGRVQVEGFGGGGTDRFDVYVGDPSNGVSALNADLTIRLDGGRGASVENLTLHRTEVFGALTLDMLGGPDTDHMNVLLEDDPESPSPLHGPVIARLTTGGGADEVGFILCRSTFLGPVNAAIGTGAAADESSFTIEESRFLGSVDAAMNTGDGEDRGMVTVNNSELFGTTNLSLNFGRGNDLGGVMVSDLSFFGALNTQIAGGGGRDDIRVIYGFNPQPDPPGEPLHIAVTIDAGSDDDRVQAAFDLAGRSNVTLHAELLGGGGHDDLGLALYGLSDPDDFTALIDGGPGRDRAGVTANVLARALIHNVEEVILIE